MARGAAMERIETRPTPTQRAGETRYWQGNSRPALPVSWNSETMVRKTRHTGKRSHGQVWRANSLRLCACLSDGELSDSFLPFSRECRDAKRRSTHHVTRPRFAHFTWHRYRRSN